MNKNLLIGVTFFCISVCYGQDSITTIMLSPKIEVPIASFEQTTDTFPKIFDNRGLVGYLIDPVFDYAKNDFELSLGKLSDQIFPISFSYYRRLKTWFWVGGTLNLISNADKPFLINKTNDLIYIGIAPAIRFSYLNERKVMLYSGLAVGAALSWGILPYFQVTAIGFSYSFNKKYCYLFGSGLYIGGELGWGLKGILNLNVGYRFR